MTTKIEAVEGERSTWMSAATVQGAEKRLRRAWDKRKGVLSRFGRVALLEREERKRLFWWQPTHGRVNVGDHLSLTIVRAVLATRDRSLLTKTRSNGRLLAVGSILHFARENDTVWGSGVNGKVPETLHTFGQLDVRAVRGPLTREFLQKRGISVPDVYGDPGLLMPLFFPREVLAVATERPFVVVPHFNETLDKYAKYSREIVSPACHPASFVTQLLGAKLVISSSLHGLILAEAYGIPALYLRSESGEDDLKYRDYYFGTGREGYRSASTVEACLALGAEAPPDFSVLQQRLLRAFPHDLWR